MQNLFTSSKTNSKNLKFVTLALTFISALLFLIIPAKSQITFCYPDCLNDHWNPLPPSPAFMHQITLPCGEPVIIHYRTRFACGTFWDLFIEEIVFVNGYNGGANCAQSMTIAQMLESAMYQLVFDNPMRYPPTNPEQDTCVDNYRVMVGGCWRASFPVGPDNLGERIDQPPVIDAPAGLLMPCVFIDCCIQSYTVCYVNGTKIVIYNPRLSVPGNCDYQYQPDCYPACE